MGSAKEDDITNQLLQCSGTRLVFIVKNGMEAGFVHPGRLLQLVEAVVSKSMSPKNRERLLQDTFAVEFFRSCHCYTVD